MDVTEHGLGIATAVNQLVQTGLATHRAIGELLGMHPTDLAAIGHLAAEGPMTQEQLRQRLRLGKGSMTALVTRLERAGHIRRAPHPSDGRASLLAATDQVVQAREASRHRMTQALAAAAGRRTPAEREAIAAFLRDAAEIQRRMVSELLERTARAAKG
jgi:DNA-binding MarR family transcriptional regulator